MPAGSRLSVIFVLSNMTFLRRRHGIGGESGRILRGWGRFEVLLFRISVFRHILFLLG